MGLNNREWASLFWLLVFVAFALSRREARSSFQTAAGIAIKPKILIPVLIMVAYVGALLYAGSRLGIWNTGLIKATVIWFVVTAVVLMMNSTRAGKERRFFLRTALRTLEWTVFIEFFTNLFVLNLIAELLLQAGLIFLVMLSAVAAQQRGQLIVKRLADGVIGLIGLGLAAYALIQLIRQWDQLDKSAYLLEFVLPVWLTIGLLPFVYVIGLYALYETAFVSTDIMAHDPAGRRQAKLAIVSTLLGRVRDIGALTGYWSKEAAEAESLPSARRVIKHFQASRRLDEARQAEEQARLNRYAGMEGTDEAGRQLDRREFEETKRALYWLATCQMGWYRNRGGRYRADLLELLGDFTSHGLPEDHGITLHVGKNGRSWWAWRRTVTGWCFAIGAAGPPPDQWEFDGPEPPKGYPGKDKRWGDGPGSLASNLNW
jgi:hypothetical protein